MLRLGPQVLPLRDCNVLESSPEAAFVIPPESTTSITFDEADSTQNDRDDPASGGSTSARPAVAARMSAGVRNPSHQPSRSVAAPIYWPRSSMQRRRSR